MAPRYLSIAETVTSADATAIAAAFEGGGEVVVCHPICATRPGRVQMLRSMIRAGLSPELARRCGWGTADPTGSPKGVTAPGSSATAPENPAPPPEDPPAAEIAPPRRTKSRRRRTPQRDPGVDAGE